MNNKLITTNNATICNPWDEFSIAKKLFQQVKSAFENHTSLNENWFWEEKNMKFYLLGPTSINRKENYLAKNFHHAFSMIFGYFVIDDGIRRNKFYADENTFLEILENLYLFKDRESHEQDFYAEMCQYAKCLIDYKIVDHFKKEYKIENGFCCKECKCRMDENSFSAILESNPGIKNSIEEKYIYCPMCGEEIPIDENIKDKLRSYQTIYKYHCFSKQQFGKEFQLKFIANLLFNKEQSEFLKNLEIKKISDPLCRELFGISINEFNRFWCFFRIDIQNQIYHAVDKFIYYEDDPAHSEYIESHRNEALRYMRRKKIKSIAETQSNKKE